jgi:chromosome segregation ATPase
MNRKETAKQQAYLAQGEIEELKQSLRYAEYVLEKTRIEKAEVEQELERHDERVAVVQREVESKEQLNRSLEEQVAVLTGQAQFATMTS